MRTSRSRIAALVAFVDQRRGAARGCRSTARASAASGRSPRSAAAAGRASPGRRGCCRRRPSPARARRRRSRSRWRSRAVSTRVLPDPAGAIDPGRPRRVGHRGELVGGEVVARRPVAEQPQRERGPGRAGAGGSSRGAAAPGPCRRARREVGHRARGARRRTRRAGRPTTTSWVAPSPGLRPAAAPPARRATRPGRGRSPGVVAVGPHQEGQPFAQEREPARQVPRGAVVDLGALELGVVGRQLDHRRLRGAPSGRAGTPPPGPGGPARCRRPTRRGASGSNPSGAGAPAPTITLRPSAAGPGNGVGAGEVAIARGG